MKNWHQTHNQKLFKKQAVLRPGLVTLGHGSGNHANRPNTKCLLPRIYDPSVSSRHWPTRSAPCSSAVNSGSPIACPVRTRRMAEQCIHRLHTAPICIRSRTPDCALAQDIRRASVSDIRSAFPYKARTVTASRSGRIGNQLERPPSVLFQRNLAEIASHSVSTSRPSRSSRELPRPTCYATSFAGPNTRWDRQGGCRAIPTQHPQAHAPEPNT